METGFEINDEIETWNMIWKPIIFVSVEIRQVYGMKV